MEIENTTSKSVKTTTIEEDMRSLEEVEDKILKVIRMVAEVTKEMGNVENPTPECVERTKDLTRDYLKTVDEICDALRKHSEVIVDYREAYRVNNLETIQKTAAVMESSVVTPDKVVNLEVTRK